MARAILLALGLAQARHRSQVGPLKWFRFEGLSWGETRFARGGLRLAEKNSTGFGTLLEAGRWDPEWVSCWLGLPSLS